MHFTRQQRQRASTLRPLAVKFYAESRRWVPVPIEAARFWLFRHPEQRLRQLQIPIDADDPGFADAMLDLVRRLTEVEQRCPDQVLDDLQIPGSDAGQLSLAANVELRQEQLMGTVEQLMGTLGADGRRAGEVQFTLLKENEQFRARASLDATQYEEAMRAHEQGDAYVIMRGVLHRSPRVSRVEAVSSFEIVKS